MKETKERKICGAKTRAGSPCQRSQMKGKTRCRLHGGASLAGVDHPNYKDGRHSKYLPDALAAKVKALELDEDILDGREEIRLLDARINQLLEELPSGGAPARWLELDELRVKALSLSASRKLDEMNVAVADIFRIIENGAQEVDKWNQITLLFMNRDKLAMSQHRRQIDQSHMISIDRQMVLIKRIIDSIQSRVTNEAVVSSIIGDLRGILTPSVN